MIAVSIFIISCGKSNQEKDLSAHSSQESYLGKPISHAYDAVIDSLISQMTLEEKSGMLHGTSMFTTAGVERLGVPELKMADEAFLLPGIQKWLINLDSAWVKNPELETRMFYCLRQLILSGHH